MKIGVLTQPLHDNYGGLLQAYALKEILESLNHEVVIIDRRSKSKELKILASKIKRLIKSNPNNYKLKPSSRQKKIISRNTLLFREKYIPKLTHLITSDKGMLELNDMGFDAYVVGSDQCWRPLYSSNITNYFLDFAEYQEDIKRISYAASFGVSNWEFNEEESERCSELAKKFDAISVREDSGINLVKDFLGMEAVHLVDPTMLIDKNHYINIAKKENIEKSEGTLKVYVLDKTIEKQNFINDVEKKLDLKQFEVMPYKRLQSDEIHNHNIEDFIFPNPAKWLRGFQDAKFVIADSFHGTVFAILFNIPFIALGNEDRGLARFESVLKMFGLEERLVTDLDDFKFEETIKKEINWDTVNAILENEKEKALSFLKRNLK